MRDLAGRGLTMIVVTYEIGFARAAADRVVFMDEGIVVEQGPPGEMLVNPKYPVPRRSLAEYVRVKA